MTLHTLAWVLVALAVTLVAAWAFFTARRLDQLHIRVDRSRDALQAALDRRCAVLAATLPALAPAARATEEVRFTNRDLASRLAREDGLQADVVKHLDALPDQVARELRDADTRVFLALRFYNDAVADTRALRLRPAVRTLRLGGTAALPEFAALAALPQAQL